MAAGGEIFNMKRCPKCSFLYLDSDKLCDLDQTPLVADDFGIDFERVEHQDQRPEPLKTPGVLRWKLNLKTLSAAIVATLIVGLMVLLSYQRIGPTLLASPAPPASQTQASKASRVSQIAQQVLHEASTRAALAEPEQEIPAETDKSAPSSTKKSSPTAEKNGRSEVSRIRVSSTPVSTGSDTKSGRGPVTIQLANGSAVQADEVWRTKAGIWYRRKGIVTFLRPERVRAMNH